MPVRIYPYQTLHAYIPYFVILTQNRYFSLCLFSCWCMGIWSHAVLQLNRNEQAVGWKEKRIQTKKKKLTHNVVCVSHLIYCTHCNLNRLDKLFEREGKEEKRSGENDIVIHLCLCHRVKNQKMCKENFSPQGSSNHSSNKVNNCFSQMLALVLLQAKVAFLWQLVLWHV